MFKDLIARKSLYQINQQAQEDSLKRHLDLTNIVLLGIGAIIGAGIFVLTGTAAALHAGPAISISFIISAFGCLLAGLCYAEFASMLPVSGSAYTYGYATLGEFVAWIIGWDLILEYLFGSATVAVGWSGYVISFLNDFGIHLPATICQSPFAYGPDGWYQTGAIINFPAVFIIALMTTLLVIGIKESARFNNIIVIIKVGVILLFVGFGISYIDVENWKPFLPENTGKFSEFGWTGVLTGAAVVFFAYIGFDAVSTTAQEAVNPQRDLPKGILLSLAVCTLLYVTVSLVMTGIVKYTELNVPAPIAVAIDATGKGLAWLSPFIKIGAIAGLSSVVMVLLLGQSRVFYSMAHDGLLWKSFAKTHPKYKTPYLTSIVTGLFAALFAGFLPIGLLGELVSIGTLLAFVIVCLGLIVLRKKEPDAPRAFRTPWVPFVPVLGALICLAQMAALPKDTWIRLIGWMLIGFVIYFSYGRKHSRIRMENHNRRTE
ncbi:MAG: basic amino acid/polyamine antiporter, family [Bacteroidota bacterium]|jgi:APA family basic amino acid/polyamine antiporter|nr:basic amino acid/polyamine antiporter, family [Bacteroidota bacterium]MDN5306553.1 basic amino acid/polyamine antiporter, family [Bacteroidota bacterium]